MAKAKYITDWSDVPVLIDVALASRILGKSYNRVRMLCANGKLPATKVGSEWRIEKGKLLSFLGAEA